MLAHIDELCGLAHCTESGFAHFCGRANHGDYRAIGGCPRVYIYQPYPLYPLDFGRNLVDNTHVAPLAEIGHALYQLLLFAHDCNQLCNNYQNRAMRFL